MNCEKRKDNFIISYKDNMHNKQFSLHVSPLKVMVKAKRQPPMYTAVPTSTDVLFCFCSCFPVVPRNNGNNNVLVTDLDIELGNTEEELKDDPGAVHVFHI